MQVRKAWRRKGGKGQQNGPHRNVLGRPRRQRGSENIGLPNRVCSNIQQRHRVGAAKGPCFLEAEPFRADLVESSSAARDGRFSAQILDKQLGGSLGVQFAGLVRDVSLPA
jgi:hypothetical protein